MKTILTLLLASIYSLLLLPSCQPLNDPEKYFTYDRPTSLPQYPSAVRVKVSLSNQMVYVMENHRPLLVMPVSVGAPRTPTPTGSFRITHKEHRRRANTHGFFQRGNLVRRGKLKDKPYGWSFKGTPMAYWCEFSPAYGFHSGWLKPYPCSHGCIRVHENLAPKFFRLVSKGTPVSIAYRQPEDLTLGRDIPRPPDATPLPNYPLSLQLSDKIFYKHITPSYQAQLP